jgi:hypothetical protein
MNPSEARFAKSEVTRRPNQQQLNWGAFLCGVGRSFYWRAIEGQWLEKQKRRPGSSHFS